jgi:hypothetical protein
VRRSPGGAGLSGGGADPRATAGPDRVVEQGVDRAGDRFGGDRRGLGRFRRAGLEQAADRGERLLVAALIFVLRGWAGYFPSKLSTSGAEYGERSSVADLSELSAAVADLRSSYMGTAQATREVLEHVASGTNDKDYML